MEVAVSAARWIVGKALAPVTGGLLEAWAASNGLGPNVDALKMELLYARAMLDNAQEREIRSPALKELLHKLQQLAYDADDVLDELEYFRIQDELDGTYHAADVHAGGCVHGLALNARHTARAIAAKLKLSSGSSSDMIVQVQGDPDDIQDGSVAKQGCLSSVCLCGGRTVSSSPPSPTTNQDGNKVHGGCMQKLASSNNTHAAAYIRNGGQFFSGVLCGKREGSSSTTSPTNRCKKKVGGGGCLLKVTSAARSIAHAVGKCLPCCSFSSVDDGNTHPGMLESPTMPEDQRKFLCWTSMAQQRTNTTALAPELKFNRVDISAKMKDITEHLKPICAKVSNILNLEFIGTNRITEKDIAKKRPVTTSDITENQLYGRDIQKNRIHGIVHRNCSANNGLVVLPIVGPGGIGKTTFTQHIYAELKSHFEVTIWICVSLNFTASRLAHDAVKQIPKVDGEKNYGSDQELIEQRLKDKRFLLVLDDMWACHEDEWKRLLVPFGRGEGKGSMVIVTTRIPEVAKMVIKAVDCPIEMERLEGEDSMHFFEACVFGDHQPWECHKELHEVGEKIVSKLKGFPLAAKTVGRLLRNQLTLEHWTRVLESKEWELQTNENDIMPALKLSYDYLPFHLQQCFYYCALFPEDYEFNSQELVHWWIGLGIVHPCDLNRRIEDVGHSYLNDLVNHGFLKRNERNNGRPYFVVHDLLHNLAVNISSFECLSICSSNIKSIQIRQDVRHLSIIVDNKDVEDIKNFKYYKNDLSTLDKRLKVENLRTLMVFGQHHGNFAKTFCDLFEKARALRTIYLSGASYTVEDMCCNLSKLIHLRYLRIKSVYTRKSAVNLSALSRLYHLEVIDLQECQGCYGFTRHMSNNAKLRHFLVPSYELQFHSNIFEVGKLKSLQELHRFEVGKESMGFELSQLGKLAELRGSLAICSLERVRAMEEATESEILHKNKLHRLTLEWDVKQHNKDHIQEEDVLEIMKPHSNIRGICIRGHGGTNCPKWLGENLSVKNLESLRLDDVSWENFPPIGELWLVNKHGEEHLGCISHNSFRKLRRLEFNKLPRFKRWVEIDPCHLYSHLEVLIITHCSELTELSFSNSTCCQQQNEAKMNWFPKLRELKMEDCPKLLSFPPVPWTSALCSTQINGVGLGFERLNCAENYRHEYNLTIEGKDDLDSTFWNIVAFDNLTEVKELVVERCPPLPLHQFQVLSSLKTFHLRHSSGTVFSLVKAESCAKYQFPLECMWISNWGGSVKELTQLLSYFPKLSKLNVWSCDKITGLGVGEKQKQATATPEPPSSVSKVDDAQIEEHPQRGAEEIAAEGMLLLPSQLQELTIWNCRELSLHSTPIPIDDNRQVGRTGGGQGLQGLSSLRWLQISDCPSFLSSCSSSSSCLGSPFPTSLEYLYLRRSVGTRMLLPLSNLTCLTELTILECEDLRGEGLWSLLSQDHLTLTELIIRETPYFFAGSEPSLPQQQEFPSSSSQLLRTDDVAGVLVAPICTFLASSLTRLDLWRVKEVERFTKEQEEALVLLVSLEEIIFTDCHKLQCLPKGLHRLPNLKILYILDCAAIMSLPKDGLPSSLKKLGIHGCPAIRSLPKDCLPSSLQELEIIGCPALQSLHKMSDLPSSLRVLDVSIENSEELRRKCRKLIGTIPIVRV